MLKHVRVKGAPVDPVKGGPVDRAGCKHIAPEPGGPVDRPAHGRAMMLRCCGVAPGCTGRLSAVPGARRRRENADSGDVAVASCGRDCLSRRGRLTGRGGRVYFRAPGATRCAGRPRVRRVDGGERATGHVGVAGSRAARAAARVAPEPGCGGARVTGCLPARGGERDTRLILPVVICLS